MVFTSATARKRKHSAELGRSPEQLQEMRQERDESMRGGRGAGQGGRRGGGTFLAQESHWGTQKG